MVSSGFKLTVSLLVCPFDDDLPASSLISAANAGISYSFTDGNSHLGVSKLEHDAPPIA